MTEKNELKSEQLEKVVGAEDTEQGNIGICDDCGYEIDLTTAPCLENYYNVNGVERFVPVYACPGCLKYVTVHTN